MKTRMITVALILGGFTAAISQAEYDDVYFTKKDRQKSFEPVMAKATKTTKTLDQRVSVSNSSIPGLNDSYTGRTINPDYQPGGVSVVTTASYFNPNYQPTGVNGQLNQRNPSNDYYAYSPYANNYGYGGGYYSPYNSWGYSPYGYGMNSGFGGYYSPYGSSWGYSPYGYGGMNSFYSGMGYGMGYGYGNGYMGGGYYGSGCYGGYYPSNVVIVNNPDAHINAAYGKRQSRTSDFATASGGSGSRGSMVTSGDQSQGGRSGRVASSNTGNTYYQRGWRQDPALNQGTPSTSGSRSSFSGGTSGGSRSSWSNSGGTTRSSSTWDNSGFSSGSRGGSSGVIRSGGSSFGGSRPSGGGSSGGGSRSSGGGGGRGRN